MSLVFAYMCHVATNQDAQEFVLFLLDQLSNEQPLMSFVSSAATTPSNHESASEKQKKPNFINDQFGGKMLSQIVCQQCHHVSNKESEMMAVISIAIPNISPPATELAKYETQETAQTTALGDDHEMQHVDKHTTASHPVYTNESVASSSDTKRELAWETERASRLRRAVQNRRRSGFGWQCSTFSSSSLRHGTFTVNSRSSISKRIRYSNQKASISVTAAPISSSFNTSKRSILSSRCLDRPLCL